VAPTRSAAPCASSPWTCSAATAPASRSPPRDAGSASNRRWTRHRSRCNGRKRSEMSTRWEKSSRPRAEDYDGRWQSLSAAGQNIHGEADLVEALLQESGGKRVLDAGCGTGRVAIELAARGFSVTGVDADAEML